MARDKMRRNETLLRELPPEQLQVIERLAMGSGVTEAADATGVSRATIYRWKQTDAAFVDELNRMSAHVRRTIQAKLRSLGLEATDVVREILAGAEYPAGMRLKAALAVLKDTGAGEFEPDEMPEAPTGKG